MFDGGDGKLILVEDGVSGCGGLWIDNYVGNVVVV